MENTSVNLYCIDFFIVIKKMQKIDKNFCTDLINEKNISQKFKRFFLYFPYKYKRN